MVHFLVLLMLQGVKSTVRGMTVRPSSHLDPQTGKHVEGHVALKLIVLHGLIIHIGQITIAFYEAIIMVNLTTVMQLEA